MDDLREENARLRDEIVRLERDLANRAQRSTIVGMVDLLMTIASSGRLVEVNSAAERFFGIRREEVLGLPIDVLACAPLEGVQLRRLAERARAARDKLTELAGSGADALLVTATPAAEGVQLLISQKSARRTRMTLEGYFSEKVAGELGRVMVDPSMARRLSCTVLVAHLRSRSETPASVERDLRDEWLASVGSVALEAGATLDSLSGGRATILFGAPMPADQHPLWAVNTTLRVKEAQRVLQSAWARRSAPLFDAGFGLDCGEVLWGETGVEQRRAFGAVGAAVDRATTLAALAAGDQILATVRTFDAVRSVLERRPEMLWRPVKFKRSDALALRSGEEAAQTIHLLD